MNLLVVGVDGGGTKTESVLLDSRGAVCGAGKGGSVNRTFVAREVAEKSLEDALSAVFAHVESGEKIAALGVCLHSSWQHAFHWAKDAGFGGPFYRFSESATAFRRAGVIGRPGIAVIAGTGSGFRYFNGQWEQHGLGAWGAGVGDEGSAFDIGLSAIKAAGRSNDGRGPCTVLLEKLLKAAEVGYFHELLAKYCWPALKQRDIALLAKIVSTAASDGDEVAVRILADAGRSLGQDTLHIARRHFSPADEFEIAYSGGVFNAGRLVTDALEERVRSEFPNARFHMPEMSAGEAVAHLTLERFNLC